MYIPASSHAVIVGLLASFSSRTKERTCISNKYQNIHKRPVSTIPKTKPQHKSKQHHTLDTTGIFLLKMQTSRLNTMTDRPNPPSVRPYPMRKTRMLLQVTPSFPRSKSSSHDIAISMQLRCPPSHSYKRLRPFSPRRRPEHQACCRCPTPGSCCPTH